MDFCCCFYHTTGYERQLIINYGYERQQIINYGYERQLTNDNS
jgi:hypothetical protein